MPRPLVPTVQALVAITLAPWLAPLLTKYQGGAVVLSTVPLVGHAWPEVACTVGLTGDIPPPSAALTLQRTTPAGVRPALLTNAQIACSSTVVPEAVVVPPRVMNVEWPATPDVATSANAWAMLFPALVPTPAGSAVGPANTKSLVKIALPYWLLYEKPPATNWFSSDAAWTIRALGPPVPLLALLIAVPVAEPTYLKVMLG